MVLEETQEQDDRDVDDANVTTEIGHPYKERFNCERLLFFLSRKGERSIEHAVTRWALVFGIAVTHLADRVQNFCESVLFTGR